MPAETDKGGGDCRVRIYRRRPIFRCRIAPRRRKDSWACRGRGFKLKEIIVTLPKRHNVFISYHHDQDQAHKDRFVSMMGDHIVDKSVNIENKVSDQAPTEAILQRIREDFIATVSVTVVLIGRCTWQRKFVDWEIGASLRDTNTNPRCGLLGILLPDHPNFGGNSCNPQLIPPRLADNCWESDTFASIYHWSNDPIAIRGWIHKAFLRRKKTPWPNIKSRHPFGRNWTGDCSRGW